MAADASTSLRRRRLAMLWGVTCAAVTTAAVVGVFALADAGRPPPVWHVADDPLRVDRFGDPLPAGAVGRLGSRRFRVGRVGKGLEILPDGRRFVAGLADDRIGVFDLATGERLRTIDAHRGFVRDRRRPWTLRELGGPSAGARPVRWQRFGLSGFLPDTDGHTLWSWNDAPSARGVVVRSSLATGASDVVRASVRTSGPLAPARRGAVIGLDNLAPALMGNQRVDLRWWVLQIGDEPIVRRVERAEQTTWFPWELAAFPSGDRWFVCRDRVVSSVVWTQVTGVEPLPLPGDDVPIQIAVVDVATGQESDAFPIDGLHPQFAWRTDGRFWCFGPAGPELRDGTTFDVVDRTARVVRPWPSGDLAVLPDAATLLVGREAFTVPAPWAARWADDENVRTDFSAPFLEQPHDVVALDGHMDAAGVRVAVRTVRGQVRVFRFDAEHRGLVEAPEGHGHGITDLAWGADGTRLRSVDRSGRVADWGIEDGRRIATAETVPGQTVANAATAVVDDDVARPRFAFGSLGFPIALREDQASFERRMADDGVPLWDLPVTRFDGESNEPTWTRNVQFMTWFDSGSGWDVAPLFVDGIPPFHLTPSPDFRHGLLRGPNLCARLLDLADGAELFVLPRNEGAVTAALWTADGRRVVTGLADGAILVWDVDAMIGHGR